MLKPRLIPFLLLKGNGLYKTRQFGSPEYVGDAINAVKIFNEKNVDEISIIDIDATYLGKTPNFSLIEKISNECRMPLCIGGGVNSLEIFMQLIKSGVEKIALSSAALSNPALIKSISEKVGSQSVVVVLDVKKKKIRSGYSVFLNRGLNKTSIDLETYLKNANDLGVGEVVINDIIRDGMQQGYDLQLAQLVYRSTSVPTTIVGGAGKIEHISDLWKKCPLMGAGAGSLFVFKGKYRAVLINYPSLVEKKILHKKA